MPFSSSVPRLFLYSSPYSEAHGQSNVSSQTPIYAPDTEHLKWLWLILHSLPSSHCRSAHNSGAVGS